MKKEASGEKGYQKENDKNTIATVFDSDEILVLSFEDNECNHVRDDYAKWVIDSAASYHATPSKEFLLLTKMVTLGQ